MEEVRSVIDEQGAVTVTCEFCQKPYKFDAIDAEQPRSPEGASPRGSDADQPETCAQCLRAPLVVVGGAVGFSSASR